LNWEKNKQRLTTERYSIEMGMAELLARLAVAAALWVRNQKPVPPTHDQLKWRHYGTKLLSSYYQRRNVNKNKVGPVFQFRLFSTVFKIPRYKDLLKYRS
jgi:hypothetical protein